MGNVLGTFQKERIMCKKLFWIAPLLIVALAQASCATERLMSEFELNVSEWRVEE